MTYSKQKKKPEIIEITTLSGIDEINDMGASVYKANQDQPKQCLQVKLQQCQPYQILVLIFLGIIALVLIVISIENAFIISNYKSPQDYPINILDPKTTPPYPTTTPSPNPTTPTSNPTTKSSIISSLRPTTTKPSPNENGLVHT